MASARKEPVTGWRHFVPWLWGGIAVALAVLAVLGVRAVFPDWGPSTPAVASPLFVPAERLHFGEVWEQKEFTWTLPVTNPNPEDVEVIDFSRTCNCTTIEPHSLVIPAGQTRDVRLTIDLTPQGRSKSENSSERSFELALWPRTRETPTPKPEEMLVLRGIIKSLLRVEPDSVDFGELSELSPTAATARLRITSKTPLQSLTGTISLTPSNVVVGQTKGSGEEFDLTVSILPASRAGPIHQEIVLAAELSSGEVVRTKVPVTGRIVKDCQSNPPEARLGARLVGEVAEESLSLYSLTRRPLVLLGTTHEGEGLTTAVDPIPRAGIVTVRLRQQIHRRGEQTGRVIVRVRTGDGVVNEVVIPVSYHGLEP